MIEDIRILILCGNDIKQSATFVKQWKNVGLCYYLVTNRQRCNKTKSEPVILLLGISSRLVSFIEFVFSWKVEKNMSASVPDRQ